MYKFIYGFMRGNVDLLLEVFIVKGIDVNILLKDMVIVS